MNSWDLTVAKRFRWEMAHRLVKGYPGNCQHNHGHSYSAVVVMKLCNLGTLNQYDMVKDYNDMKVLKEWIDTNWDHATMICAEDTALLEFIRSQKNRYFIIESNSTAESIARYLFQIASEKLNDEYAQVFEVKVNETETSEAVYREE